MPRVWREVSFFTKAYPKPEPRKKVRHQTVKVAKETCPLEETEQITVIDWLTAHKVLFQASMMGANLHPTTRNRMKRMGCQPGFPDIMVYQRPPAYKDAVGVAIELKRVSGGKVSPEQFEWQKALKAQGWVSVICRGADEAIAVLEEAGYGGKR